jgi:ABC-type dipeptide/oligopeptide/nickel transport system ATPase component
MSDALARLTPAKSAAKWKQGEHVIIIGDTGSGKTYLESKLLDLRDHTIVIKTKPDDIKFPGYRTIKKYTDIGDLKTSKFVLDAGFDMGLQRHHIANAINLAWKQEGWTIAVDETYYWTSVLRLERQLNMLLTQGRSKHLTIVAGMQRPAWISRFALSQATHAFIFRCEGRDLTTLSQALSPKVVKQVEDLRGHDFVYFNRATREVVTGNANKLSEIIVRG